MATTRRAIALLALTLSAVMGVSAFTSSALAYPPGTKAKVTTDKNRVDPGQQITISGQNYRTSARVTITITCRAGNPAKTYTTTYRAKASGGSFNKTITIGPDFPNGRCRVTATTGRSAENSDNTKFFVNTPGRRGNSNAAVKLSSSDGSIPAAGSGGSVGAVLVGGLSLAFLIGGAALLITGRRRNAVVRS